jgi:hypothetical protein
LVHDILLIYIGIGWVHDILSMYLGIGWAHNILSIFLGIGWVHDILLIHYIQINTWAFPYWPGYHPETPILARDENRDLTFSGLFLFTSRRQKSTSYFLYIMYNTEKIQTYRDVQYGKNTASGCSIREK